MVDGPISTDPLITDPTLIEDIPVISAGINKRISYANLISLLDSGDITDFQAAVTANAAVALNTAKLTYPAADKTKVGHLAVTQAVDLDVMETDIAANNAKITYPASDSDKVGHLAVTQAVDLDVMETDIGVNNAKLTYPAPDATKMGFISVTQAVDLDQMEIDIAASIAVNGTFDMTIQDNSFSDGEGQTYSVQGFKYQKINGWVKFKGRITNTSLGTLTAGNGAFLAGLPFTSEADSNTQGSISIGFGSSLAIAAGTTVTGTIETNNTIISLRHWDSATGVSGLLISELSAGADLMITGIYKAA